MNHCVKFLSSTSTAFGLDLSYVELKYYKSYFYVF